MERLTKKYVDGQAYVSLNQLSTMGENECVGLPITKLARYEDLEEQGLLLRLPVAIGSDVFFIPSKANFGLNVLHHYEKFNRVYHQKVARINFTENGWYVEGNLNLEYGVIDKLFVDKLYKETWFTTKEEAEAALEKMKGE